MSLKKTYSDMARPLGVRGHKRKSYLVASYKAGREMFVEEGSEHTVLLAADVDPRCVDIASQPFTVRLDLQKIFQKRSEAIRAEPKRPKAVYLGAPIEERVYTPDFLVTLENSVEIVIESKSSTEVQRLHVELVRRGTVLNALGYRYLVVPNSEVEYKGLHSNLSLLRDAMNYRIKNDTVSLLDDLSILVAKRDAPFAFSEIRPQTSDLALYLGLISGVIGCDLRSGRFSINTLIWPAHGDLGHLQLLNLEA